MSKTVNLLMFFASAILSITASAVPRIINHEMGDTPLDQTPSRIVVLEFSFLEALSLVGVTPVGVADDNRKTRVPARIRNKLNDWLSVGARKQPSLERIRALNPDLIIADWSRHQTIYDALNQIAPTLVFNSFKADYHEILTVAQRIGDAVGKGAAMQQRLAQHDLKMAAVRAQIANSSPVAVMLAVSWHKGFSAHTSVSFAGSILEQLGLSNVLQENSDVVTRKLTLEQIITLNPDALYLMNLEEESSATPSTLYDQWKKSPLWAYLKAVKNSRVFFVDRNIWARFRGVQTAEWVAEQTLEKLGS